MSLQSDDNPPVKHKDLVFILAIAGRIDAQSTVLAQELDRKNHIYKAYAVLDSLSSSYSMFKYFFDVCLGGSADAMHEFMLTPGGIIGITLESLFLVSFSFLACHFDKEKKDNFKKSIADAWPYVRDVMKGLKNAYKGWRSTVIALSLLQFANISTLIIPVGLALGVAAAANRYFMRSITEARKAMMIYNSKILIQLKEPSPAPATVEELEIYLKEYIPQGQTQVKRYLGYVSAAIGGLVDGLYLYVGALSLSVLAPSLLLVMASVCAFYTLACIITRIYEERDFQLRLLVIQSKCDLLIVTKRIQVNYAQLLLLEALTNKTPEQLRKIKHLKSYISELIGLFEEKRSLLQQQTNRTYLSSCLLGLRNGLYAYGALSSVLFLISTFLVLAGVSFPPLAIAIVVFTGLVFIAGFVTHAVIENYQHRKKLAPVEEEAYQELLVMKTRFLHEEQEAAELLKAEQLNVSLRQGLSVKAAPSHLFQEWFEIVRSWFSGLGKGHKFIEFAGNPLQEAATDGHYQDTPIMLVLGALSAFLFAIVLALRALARGLGRPPLGAGDNLASAVIDPKQSTTAEKPIEPVYPAMYSEVTKTETPGESVLSAKRNDSPLKNADSLLSIVGFFKAKEPILERSKSAKTLNELAAEPSTVAGLN